MNTFVPLWQSIAEFFSQSEVFQTKFIEIKINYIQYEHNEIQIKPDTTLT